MELASHRRRALDRSGHVGASVPSRTAGLAHFAGVREHGTWRTARHRPNRLGALEQLCHIFKGGPTRKALKIAADQTTSLQSG
jgi:hypothetical protein